MDRNLHVVDSRDAVLQLELDRLRVHYSGLPLEKYRARRQLLMKQVEILKGG